MLCHACNVNMSANANDNKEELVNKTTTALEDAENQRKAAEGTYNFNVRIPIYPEQLVITEFR